MYEDNLLHCKLILTESEDNNSIRFQSTDGPESSRNRWNKCENEFKYDFAKSLLSAVVLDSNNSISFLSWTNESRWVTSLNSNSVPLPLGVKFAYKWKYKL